MKTITLTQVTAALKSSISVFALVATLALVGCGSKSNNNAVNNGWNYGTCYQNCVSNGSVNVTASARNDYSGVSLYIQFIGQQSTSYGSSGSYYGPIQAQGTLTVQTNIYAQCGLPAGSYSVSTVQAGTWQGSSIFQNLVLTASSGVQITMSGYTKTSASSGGVYGMSANLYPMNQQACEMVLY